ncbi:tetratricopeptide repeat protein 37, partial [Elysia marginata]
DETKQLPQLYKLLDLHMRADQKDEALQTLDVLLSLEKEAEKRIKPLCTFISLRSSIAPKIAEKDLQKYESSLREVVFTEKGLVSDRDHYARLLLHFTSQIKLNELPSTCDELIQVNSTLPSPLEFQLRFTIDNSIGEGCPSQATCDDVKRLTSALSSLHEDNTMVKVGLAFSEIQNKNFMGAKELLLDLPEDCISGSYFMAQTCLYLHSNVKGLEACERGLHALSKDEKIICAPPAHVLCLFNLAKTEAYMGLGTADAQSKALMLIEEVQEQMPTEAFLMKAYIFLHQGKVSEAKDCAKYLRSEALPVQILRATILYKERAFSAALKILENVVEEDARATLLLGKVLWELRSSDNIENVKQKCFTTLLKAAKLDPYNYEAFFFIGNFYRHIQQDLVKARRCFQKASDLQPESDECSAALVNTLLELGEEEQSLKILQKVTQMALAGGAKWAWLRLGLHQMRHDDPSTAIMSLQCALRADPDDQHVWECLAEAYLQRGSLTASLKAFTKASEYKTVLQKSPTYVPALKGISESLIQLAKQNLSQCLDGLAQSHFEEAIAYTARAATQRPDMSCLWKLMGDACSGAYCLASDSYSVPAKLMSKQVEDQTKEDKVKVSKMELLKIGSRCYSQALKILPESGYLWHDLGVNVFYQSQHCSLSAEHPGDSVALVNQAAQIMKKAISFQHKEWRHWNALGVIACSKVYPKPALAQHCFIKSIECEASNAIAWTNLGALYLDKGEVKALIAEMVGHEEAMDLFRHTTELGFHVESAVSYGQWVLSVLADSSKRDSDLFRYCIQQMAALPAASDALTRYTTLKVLESTSVNSEATNKTRLNLARVLCKQKKFEECVQCYEKCDLDSSLENMCMYGLALLLCGRTEDSLKEAGQAALEELVKSDPTDAHAWSILARTALSCSEGNQQAAAQYARASLELGAESSEVIFCGAMHVQWNPDKVNT